VKHRLPKEVRATDRLRMVWLLIQIAVWIGHRVNDR
jgi:hypothetical protein